MKKFLLVAALGACVSFAQQAPAKKNTHKQTQSEAKEETTPQTDLVCGMTVDPKTAEAKQVYKGKTYYFCSREDQQTFAKEPEKYVKK